MNGMPVSDFVWLLRLITQSPRDFTEHEKHAEGSSKSKWKWSNVSCVLTSSPEEARQVSNMCRQIIYYVMRQHIVITLYSFYW